MESAHVQKMSVGKLDVSLTTCIARVAALGITYSKLATYYEGVTEEDEREFTQHLKEQREKKGIGKG